jgi:hypothetical protein
VVAIHSLREIAEKLQVRAVAATIGNHDVDSHQLLGKGTFFAVKEMFLNFPLIEIAQQNSFFNSGFACIEGEDFRVLSINSVLSHTSKESAQSGSANTVQLAAIRKALQSLDPKRFQLCLVHHHVIPHEELDLGAKDLLVGGEELLSLLEEFEFALVVHGHKHHPRLRYSTSGRLPIFASGSMSAAIDPVTGTSCRNTVHIITLSEPSADVPNPHGRIHSWDLRLDKGWQRTSRESSSFPGVEGFGCHTSVHDIAKSIAGAFGKLGKTVGLWEEITASVPAVQFLIPSDMDALAKVLEFTYGLFVRLDAAEPQLIGRKTQ